MGLTPTILIMATGLGIFLGSWRIAARPADPARPRRLNWNLMMVLGAFIMFTMLVHLVNLAGFTTGRW